MAASLGKMPVTTAFRSLATALSKARFASGTRPKTYTTTRDTTLGPRTSENLGCESVDALGSYSNRRERPNVPGQRSSRNTGASARSRGRFPRS
jgi:hypothetical protein